MESNEYLYYHVIMIFVWIVKGIEKESNYVHKEKKEDVEAKYFIMIKVWIANGGIKESIVITWKEEGYQRKI